jgi:oligoendopeptidase F
MDLIYNLITFVHCEQSLDAKNSVARSKHSFLMDLMSKFEKACLPIEAIVKKLPQNSFEDLMQDPIAAPYRFAIEQERKDADLLLTSDEETLISGLANASLHPWGNLYNQLMGTISVEYTTNAGTENISMARAQAYLGSPSEEERRQAWLGVQTAWTTHEEAAAFSLNALAAWRLELVNRRSKNRKIDFLHAPLKNCRINDTTLSAMMTALFERKNIAQEALSKMATALGKEKLDPWDLLAPAPLAEKQELSFESALNLVEKACTNFHPEMGEFIRYMRDQNWIESRILPNKRGGAYCTWFPKSRTPRVFQTFTGTSKDLTTLAHELGHAFHSWKVRDLPSILGDYPMTLAETASIFTETLLTDYLIQESGNPDLAYEASFADIVHAGSLLANIPARFEFEYELHTQRAHGELNPDQLRAICDQAWTKWYGNTLSQNDQMFWATKLHFYFSHISFYNFPYTFGYLFSLSIYSRKQELGKDFFGKYVDILRDTGSMTAEDLVSKHLDEDISKPEFWNKSLSIVEKKVKSFQPRKFQR